MEITVAQDMTEEFIVIQIGTGRIGNVGMARTAKGKFVKQHLIVAETMEILSDEIEVEEFISLKSEIKKVHLLFQIICVMAIHVALGLVKLVKSLVFPILNIKSNIVSSSIVHMMTTHEDYLAKCYEEKIKNLLR